MADINNIQSKRFRWPSLFWLLPGPLFYLLYRLSFFFPEFIEKVYSRGIFRVTNRALSTATGWMSFSLGEFLLYCFAIFTVVYFLIMLIRSIIYKKGWWKTLLKRLFAYLCICSFLYASFIGLWAFNYARKPLGETLELDTSPARVEELYETCLVLAKKAAVLRTQTGETSSGIYFYDKYTAMISTTVLYNKAAYDTGYDFLGGSFGRAKPVLYSEGLSHLNITGVYFPFTGEANLNADAPCLFFASAALHEAAHQRGFAREDEANFLAYYVSSYSDDPDTQYSGTMLALVHSMNKLYAENENLYYDVKKFYTVDMQNDLDDYRDYWSAYKGKASETFEQVNDSYLKSNMQSDGTKSYGRMVDLLIGLWRSGEL